jgi:hypothetical protein
MPNLKGELKEYFWPSVNNAESAKRLAHFGAGAAFFEGGFEVLLTTVSLMGVKGVMRLNAGAYIDASVFSHSRILHLSPVQGRVPARSSLVRHGNRLEGRKSSAGE